MTKRIKWIDCAKAVAIIAVLTDHCYGILYKNKLILQLSYFSVSLFVLLSGVSVWISDAYEEKTLRKQIKKAGRIYAQYAIATFLLLTSSRHFFDLKNYILYLLNFSIADTFYYLVFFLQLTIIAPGLLMWCKYCNMQRLKYIWHMLTVLLLCYISSVCIRFTNILPVYGGGQYLFGGTYLILYYTGILLGSLNVFINSRRKRIFILGGSLSAAVIWGLMGVRGKLPFDRWLFAYWGEGYNPPSIRLMIYALIMLFLLYSLFATLNENENRIWKIVLKLLSVIGKYTLYIFMYHLWIRDRIVTYFPEVMEMNIWITRIAVFIPMLLFPVGGVVLIQIIIGRIGLIKKDSEYVLFRKCISADGEMEREDT